MPANAPINLEYSLLKTKGTIAMARDSAPNTATFGWFLNVADNSAPFSPGVNSTDGYASFGHVIGTGMTVIEAISALPASNASVLNAAFTNMPLAGYTSPPGYVTANSRSLRLRRPTSASGGLTSP